MKQFSLLTKNSWLIFLLLPLMGGCGKELKGYEKVIGTATINEQEYKESTVWAWNYAGYPSSIRLFEDYKLFHFIAQLSPEINNNPSYTINFYVFEDDMQLKLNHPYKIDFYKDLDVESLNWHYVIPYLSENKNKILDDGADGIAYAESSDSEDTISLKGEFIFENYYSQTGVYEGSYSLVSSRDDSKKLVINGKFAIIHSIIKGFY